MSFKNGIVNEYDHIDLPLDKKLSQFLYICKKKRPNLEQWIELNELDVDSSISISSTTFAGFTPLHLAIVCKSSVAVKALLKRDADISIKNANGQTALHLAAKSIMHTKSIEKRKKLEFIADQILSETSQNQYANPVDRAGLSHFHVACYRNNTSLVSSFLERNVNVNQPVNFDSVFWTGYTPLHIAVKYGLLSIANILLNKGANINLKDATGLTPFHCAIKNGNSKLVISLFAALKQNSINPVDYNGLSLLHFNSMIAEAPDSLDEFIQNNVDINVAVKKDLWAGWTPLHVAVHHKNIYFISLLINSGANVNIKSLDGLSPLQLSIHKRVINTYLLDLLIAQYNKTAVIPIENFDSLQLFGACMCGNTKLIKYLLHSNVDINMSVPIEYPFNLPGYTPLHFAVEYGDVEIIQLLLENGGDSSAQDSYGTSPLHLAAKRKNLKAVNILTLSTDITKNPIDSEGYSHLHIMCMVDQADIVKKLLDSVITSIDLISNSSETPLHISARFNSINVLKLLLDYKADVTVQNAQSLTPLHVAIEKGNEEAINSILLFHVGNTTNPIDNTGFSHFHIACMKNKLELVKSFLEAGINVNSAVHCDATEHAGFTGLHFAVKYNCTDIIDILLKHGASIFSEDKNKKTPLHFIMKKPNQAYEGILNNIWPKINTNSYNFKNDFSFTLLHIACMRDDAETVENLLKKGASVNKCVDLHIPSWPGFSPLHFAVKYGSIKTVDILLAYGANVNVADKHGLTTLHIACSCSKIRVVEKLLLHNSDPTAKSTRGLTPLRMALNINNFDIVQKLLFHDKSKTENPKDNKGLTYFHVACLNNLYNVVEDFLKHRTDIINEAAHPLDPNYPSYTPLHMAIEKGHVQIVKILLNHGANVNCANGHGQLPIHLSLLPHIVHKKITYELFLHGSFPDARNALGDTVLELALKNNQSEILDLALHYGANPNLANPIYNHRRPLQLAIENCRVLMVERLLLYGAKANIDMSDGSNLIHWTVCNVPSCIHTASKANIDTLAKIFILLLENGCDLNELDAYGQSPLHRTYWPSNYSALEALLSCGADINTEDRAGRTIVSFLFEIASSRIDRSYLYRVLLRHLELRRLTGPQLSPTNEALYDTLLEASEVFQDPAEESFYDIDDDYALEKEKMSEVYFGNYVTLLDLYRDTNAMARHLSRNGCLKKLIRSGKIQQDFPLNSCSIMMRYAKAYRRKDLLRPAIDALTKLMQRQLSWLNWSDEMSDAIIEYLEDQDLRNLATV